jgi:hypothetical protein
MNDGDNMMGDPRKHVLNTMTPDTRTLPISIAGELIMDKATRLLAVDDKHIQNSNFLHKVTRPLAQPGYFSFPAFTLQLCD